MPPRKPTASGQLSRRIAVLIKHGTDINTAIPKVVWMHEVALLEAIHGEGRVEEIPNAKLNEHFRAKATADLLVHNKAQDAFTPPSDALGVGFVFTGDLESEYHRLAAVYGKHKDIDISLVEHIYGRFQTGRFEELIRPGEISDMSDAQLRQLIRGHGYVPGIDKDSTPEQRAESQQKHREVNESPRERLIDLAEELINAYA